MHTYVQCICMSMVWYIVCFIVCQYAAVFYCVKWPLPYALHYCIYYRTTCECDKRLFWVCKSIFCKINLFWNQLVTSYSFSSLNVLHILYRNLYLTCMYVYTSRSVEEWEIEVGTQAHMVRVSTLLYFDFWVLPNFHKCFYNVWEHMGGNVFYKITCRKLL